MTLDIAKGTFSYKSLETNTTYEQLHSALYVKDKFTISNEVYHELSMISDLPGSSQIKKLTGVLNLQYDIKKCPNGINDNRCSAKYTPKNCVQCLTHFVKQASTKALSIPETFRIKITVNRTQIARSFNIVNIVFTILEEKCKASSVFGNYSVAILKIIENYEAGFWITGYL